MTFFHCTLLPSPFLSSRGTRDLLGLHTFAHSENETGTFCSDGHCDILALYAIPFPSIPKRSLVPRDDSKKGALTKRHECCTESSHDRKNVKPSEEQRPFMLNGFHKLPGNQRGPFLWREGIIFYHIPVVIR